MPDPNFIQQFDEKIHQLNKLRGRIDSTINMRREFTQDLKDRLNEISKSITTLYGLISELKQNRDNLANDLNANKANIQNNTDEINRCKKTIDSLTREKEQMTQRLKEQEQAIIEKNNEKTNIEAELRDLRQANETQKTELSALKNEGTQKDRQHAEALERLNEQHTKQLADQEAQLLARISELDNQITALNEQLSSNNEQLTNSQQSLQQQINEKQEQIVQLTIENERLQEQNNALQQQIRIASEAIETAIRDLTILMDREPNKDSEREIIEILNNITDQIESSITIINNINNNNNNTPASAPAQGTQDAVIIRDYPPKLQVQDLDGDKVTIVLNDLNDRLDKKDNIIVKNTKNAKIQKAISDIKSQRQNGTLSEQKLKQFYNNAFQKGGKRTRKMRNKKMRKTRKIKKSKKHQKGGFIYNPNTKRKKLKSSKNATRSRSSTRKRTYSSKTSRQRSKSSKSSF